jgi:hypothetical protein
MRRSNDLLVGTIVLLVILTLTGATFWVKQTDIGERRSKVVSRCRKRARRQRGGHSRRSRWDDRGN